MFLHLNFDEPTQLAIILEAYWAAFTPSAAGRHRLAHLPVPRGGGQQRGAGRQHCLDRHRIQAAQAPARVADAPVWAHLRSQIKAVTSPYTSRGLQPAVPGNAPRASAVLMRPSGPLCALPTMGPTKEPTIWHSRCTVCQSCIARPRALSQRRLFAFTSFDTETK